MGMKIQKYPDAHTPDPDTALRLSREELGLGLSHILLALKEENVRKRTNLLQDARDALNSCLSNPILQEKFKAKLGVVGMIISQIDSLLRLREEDIKVHKWLLSERAGYDVGLLVSAAHWLKEHGRTFYNVSTEQI